MIIQAILFLIASFLNFLMARFAIVEFVKPVVDAVVSLSKLLDYGLLILPARCWNVFIFTFVGFKTLHFNVAVVKWVLNKIPGVNW